ncbi:SufS family cysteine desulfurase [Spiribacter sp. C176]|uniref:cysteine desulfurase n=1 Tax=Spiribacter salilacus TaxID=2664894 RepID=A0A6N7QQE7_9GAMM|nr:cysteine desulfurase [Spiribacter salilacus]MRH77378.1 SufS family cysteine desulfurase [Spiribacter salilacus]
MANNVAHRIRDDFPILGKPMNGHRLAFLDSAASAQKPQVVIDAERECYESYYANIHRGVYSLSQQSTQAYEAVRGVVKRFINAPDEREIVFVRGATEAINLVAQSFVRPKLGPGDEVLITGMEHHANIVPWQMVTEATGAKLVVVPVNDDGTLDVAAYRERLNERTRFVSFVHVSNTLGTVNPAEEMIALAKAKSIPVLLDGAQSAPHMPVDIQALGADFYCFSGHKTYGPSGVGVLWGRLELLEAMPPYQGGGDMIRTVSFEKTEYAEPPQRFEAGTPNIAGVIGMGAGLEYLEGVGMAAVAAHEQTLLSYATEQLKALPGLKIIGTAPQKTGVISFVMEDAHPHDIGTILDMDGVAVRTGHHCTQPLMARFGVPATARASFGVYTVGDDIDALVSGLKRVRKMFA